MTRSRSRAVTVVALGALLLLTVGAGLSMAADKGVSIVEVGSQYAFQPANIEVNVGDTVRWTNNSDAPHTVTADGGSFDSATFGANADFEWTFETAGEFDYFCELHSYMTGTVNVVEATQTPPETDATPSATAGGGSAPSLLSLVATGAALLVLGGWAVARRRRAEHQGTAP